MASNRIDANKVIYSTAALLGTIGAGFYLRKDFVKRRNFNISHTNEDGSPKKTWPVSASSLAAGVSVVVLPIAFKYATKGTYSKPGANGVVNVDDELVSITKEQLPSTSRFRKVASGI